MGHPLDTIKELFISELEPEIFFWSPFLRSQFFSGPICQREPLNISEEIKISLIYDLKVRQNWQPVFSLPGLKQR